MTTLVELRAAVSDLVWAAISLPDEAMDLPYAWGEYDEDGLRFALLSAYHQLRDLAFEAEDNREPRPTQAQRILGGLVQAHADIDGLLASVSDAELDTSPGGEEWPLRGIVHHVLRADDGFASAIRRALADVREGREHKPYTLDEWRAHRNRPSPEGGIDAVRAAMRESLDAVVSEFGGLSDKDLETQAYFWEKETFPIRFRLIRVELHLRQHTVQADKTMAAIGHTPTEAERLCRLVYLGLGDVEAALLGAPEDAGAPISAVDSSLRVLAKSVRDIGGRI